MQLDRTNQNRVIGAGTALSGVVSLALLANPITDILGIAFLFSGLGYSIATQLMAGWTRDQERQWAHKNKVAEQRAVSAKQQRADDRAEIAQQREQIEQARAEIAEEIKQVNHRHNAYQAELKRAFDAEVAQAIELLGNEARGRIATLEAEYAEKLEDADRKALTRIKKHKSQHREHERQLHARIAELEGMVVEHDAYLKAEFDKVLGDTDAMLAGEIKGVQMAKAAAMEDIQQRDLIIERLKGLVEANGAPKKFRGSSADDQIANKVIDLLLQAGIKVHGDNWDRRYSQLILWVESAIAVTSEIECQLENIQLALGLYNRPTVALERGLYKIVLDTDAKGATAKTVKIIDPPLTKLETAISESIHIRIAANSGSGKSVLMGNLINYLSQTFSSDYEASDPKVTDPDVWGDIDPQHLGTECLGHLFNLIPSVMDRVDLVKDAIRNKASLPAFDPQFHIFDELEMLYGLAEVSGVKEYSPKAFKNNVKIMLKAGREHKLKLLFVTQSPLPSDLNLRKNDLYNTSSILLGKCISDALCNDDKDSLLGDLPRDKRAVLKAEYKARLERGDQYSFLFYDPSKPLDAWLGNCPPPGHYSPSPAKTETPVLGGVDPVTLDTVQEGASQQNQGVQTVTLSKPVTLPAPSSGDLGTLLAAGTHCPDCGHHSARYSKKSPNTKGNVSVKCLNKECSRKTFQWKPV